MTRGYQKAHKNTNNPRSRGSTRNNNKNPAVRTAAGAVADVMREQRAENFTELRERDKGKLAKELFDLALTQPESQ